MKKVLFFVIALTCSLSLFAFDNVVSFEAGYQLAQFTDNDKNGFALDGFSIGISGENYFSKDSSFGVGYSFYSDFPISTYSIVSKDKKKDGSKAFDVAFSASVLLKSRFDISENWQLNGGIGLGAFFWGTEKTITDTLASSTDKTFYLMPYVLLNAEAGYSFSDRFSVGFGTDCGYVFKGKKKNSQVYKKGSVQVITDLGTNAPYFGFFARPFVKVSFCY